MAEPIALRNKGCGIPRVFPSQVRSRSFTPQPLKSVCGKARKSFHSSRVQSYECNDELQQANMTSAKTMKAVVFKGKLQVAIEDRPIPKIQDPTDIVVKVRYTALCGRCGQSLRSPLFADDGIANFMCFAAIVSYLLAPSLS